jgi:hypothetical protein
MFELKILITWLLLWYFLGLRIYVELFIALESHYPGAFKHIVVINGNWKFEAKISKWLAKIVSIKNVH